MVGCCPVVSSKASHQPDGRQSISLAPPSLSRLLVPLVSINVDSCQSQKESMMTKKKKILKNPIIPLLWLKAAWMMGDAESERLRPIGALPQPASTILCLRVCSYALLQSACVVFYVVHFFPALTQASALAASSLKEELEMDTCWVKLSSSITSLLYHKRPQRTPGPHSCLSGIRLCCFD